MIQLWCWGKLHITFYHGHSNHSIHRSLSGGGLFVTTVVLGTVVMAANLTLYKIGMILLLGSMCCPVRHVYISANPIDKLDFMRDLIAYLLVVAVIVAVAYDGIVSSS